MFESVAPPTYDFKTAVSDNRLKGLWRMTAGYRLSYLLAVLGMGTATVLRTSTQFLLRYFVDEVLARAKFGRALVFVALSFVGLALLRGGFTFLSGRLAARTAEGIVLRLRNYLFDHMQRLSFTYHDRTQTGELMQRATSDVDAVRRFFSDQVLGMCRIVMLFGINLVALLSLNVELALFSIVVVPLIVGLSYLFFKKVAKAYEAYQEQEATLSTTLQESLTGIRVVKAFSRQAYERAEFERDNSEWMRRGRRLVTMHSLYWPISVILCGLQMMAGLFLGALMTLDGRISMGTYVAYTGLVVWIIWPMHNMGRLIMQVSTGLVSYGRVAQVIREEREPLDDGAYRPSGDVQGDIAFRDVSFEYDADIPVLRDICLRCRPGQVVALLGSTGSGKTTLVNLLPRFYDCTGGSLTLDGVDVREYPRHFMRQQIGIVEQEPFLFSRTIRENITYGVDGTVSDDEVEAAARAAAIHDVIASFPDGYDTLVGERGVTLSGGQKQRVAIARALLKDPRILILDDATSSVDTQTETSIRQALQHLMEGRSSFIIAHRVQSVMNADLILVLDQGRIVQRGTHAELIAQDGMYHEIHDMQARIETERETQPDKELASVEHRV